MLIEHPPGKCSDLVDAREDYPAFLLQFAATPSSNIATSTGQSGYAFHITTIA